MSDDLGGSRTLITGAGGFIGSHLTKALLHAHGPRQSARAFLPAVLTQAITSDVVSLGALDPVRT